MTQVTINDETQQIFTVKLVRVQPGIYGGGIELQDTQDAAELLSGYIHDDASETLVALFMDTQNRVIAYRRMFSGTINAVEFSPREIMQTALLCNAARILVGHNHPGGTTKPSPEDLHSTDVLIEAGQVLGIEVVDHIIISSTGKFASILDQRLIEAGYTGVAS
ncbi:JAB domain-containing protein [Lacticaseibacillus sharpeae]|uniref:MPN domain-containing protein n=1 Tax=Lacticaseibacillus sharpeae JCM 1186 = DSM 20505 TaxID=1291052 RepID=A0A0R2A083_9LACO|nr:JAB domain-containing protein [Lacticaseibacillus sharpeae]KRM56668.1 hypothetical protein FC18_GL001802 [Lacticaseibacillus sharpeae JCM 1186 = DSM 20505]